MAQARTAGIALTAAGANASRNCWHVAGDHRMGADFRYLLILLVTIALAGAVGGPTVLAADPDHRHRPKGVFLAGEDHFLPARTAPEDAEFPAQPRRGGRYRGLYRFDAQIRRAKTAPGGNNPPPILLSSCRVDRWTRANRPKGCERSRPRRSPRFATPVR